VLIATDDGSAVVLHDLGGEGASILICHATGFCGGAYEQLARTLAERLHVWALDMRGHGDSPASPDGGFGWATMVWDVLAARRAINDDVVHVLGHSMGGAVALQTEADHPGTFASAYLYEPIIVPAQMRAERTQNGLADGAARRQAVFPSKADALWRYASRAPLNVLEAGSLLAYVEHGLALRPDGSAVLKCTPATESGVFESSATITTGSVARVQIPVIVATGGEAESPFAALAAAVVSALPVAQSRMYSQLGHFGPLQDSLTIGRDVIEHVAASAGA
jgi:pimeloyl-ACP methyl ester carboxylesterase